MSNCNKEDLACVTRILKVVGLLPSYPALLTERMKMADVLAEYRESIIAEESKMLDWMIGHGAFISHSRDGDVCNVWLSQDPNDESNGAVPAEGYPQKCYNDAREAIRGAMQS